MQLPKGWLVAKRREATMKGTTKLRPKKLEPWSGAERWEKKHAGELIWVEILPFGETHRVLRNDLGDRWTETVAEVEAHRLRLRADGSVMVKIGQTTRESVYGELGQQILDAMYELAHGKTNVPVRITTLRSRVHRAIRHHRTDFDEAIQGLQDARRVRLFRQDNPAELLSDDEEDAVWIGDVPRHLAYLR